MADMLGLVGNDSLLLVRVTNTHTMAPGDWIVVKNQPNVEKGGVGGIFFGWVGCCCASLDRFASCAFVALILLSSLAVVKEDLLLDASFGAPQFVVVMSSSPTTEHH